MLAVLCRQHSYRVSLQLHSRLILSILTSPPASLSRLLIRNCLPSFPSLVVFTTLRLQEKAIKRASASYLVSYYIVAALPCSSIRIGFVTFTDEEAVEKVLKASEEDLVLDTLGITMIIIMKKLRLLLVWNIS